jgi:hypothetical protein
MILNALADDSPDDGIQSWTVTATREQTDPHSP